MGNHMWSIILMLLVLEQLVAESVAANLVQLVKKQSQQKQVQSSQGQQAGQQQPQGQQIHTQQYVQDTLGEQDMKSEDEEEQDPYQLLQESKQESRLPNSANYPWSPYAAPQGNPYEAMPKMLPFIGYAQPVLIPFPLYLAPDMFYPTFSGASNDLEDVVMSRASGGRRPGANHASPARNSPIYYVRVPPTPYMFLPNMPTAPFGGGFSPLLTYQPMPSFSAYGSVFNLPVNFLANGKPTGIYQVNGSPGEAVGSLTPGLGAGGYGMRPPTPSNPYRPMSSSSMGSYGGSQQSFGLASIPVPQQDSKLTSLKRPFVFNGRPEDIYILPNNLSPLYNEQSYY
ncbi:uncharacterized protein LOC6555219 [Drosophila erecta]|uniref:GG12521 n=1 Tax=Drosophila erecta TaxID=7220 RepID=B3P7J6_DROER|nr:uncharacterized protein LOC6555219 [Drosophila erecta]EDV54157.1 uncharacterized protein Dere_GG12521 [Drosophila erecta]